VSGIATFERFRLLILCRTSALRNQQTGGHRNQQPGGQVLQCNSGYSPHVSLRPRLDPRPSLAAPALHEPTAAHRVRYARGIPTVALQDL